MYQHIKLLQMKKETRDKKILEYISSLPDAVQMDKGVILYHMADR